MVAGSENGCGGPVTSGRADSVLRHVDRVPDPEVSYARTGRAPLDETVTFVDG